jgi:hypothetical protein
MSTESNAPQSTNESAHVATPNEGAVLGAKSNEILNAEAKVEPVKTEVEPEVKSETEAKDILYPEKKIEEKIEEKPVEKKTDDNKDFELEFSQESRLSEADKKRIASYTKEQGLSKDAAQKLIETQESAKAEYFSDLQTEHKQMVSKWADQVKTDKEIGGDNYAKNVELARRVIGRFATKELLESLDSTGFGNNPEVVRVFARIGRHMASDELITGKSTSSGPRTMESVFYGDKQN